MADEKKKYDRITSPKGIAKFPALSAPDTKFKKDGEYHVELLLSNDDDATQAFAKAIEDLSKEAFAEQVAGIKAKVKREACRLHLPFKEDLNKEGEPTGFTAFSFKTSAKYKDRKTEEMVDRKLAMFDAKGKPITTKINVGGGSVLRVNFTPFAFYNPSADKAGVSLRLEAVQILQLKTYARSASDYGFGAEEGEGMFSAEESQSFEGGSEEKPEAGAGDY